MPKRERWGSMRDSPWEARRGALAWQKRDRWRSAPRRRNPPPCTSSILLLSPVLSPPCAGAFPALRLRSPPRYTGALARVGSRSPQHYIGALPHATPALDFALRPCFTLDYAGALCRCRRNSLRFVALPRPSPALCHTVCRHLGTPRPLGFNTTCGATARWGVTWWGGLPCLLPQSNYCLA